MPEPEKTIEIRVTPVMDDEALAAMRELALRVTSAFADVSMALQAAALKTSLAFADYATAIHRIKRDRRTTD